MAQAQHGSDDEIRRVRERFETGPPQAMTDEDDVHLDRIVAVVGGVHFPATQAGLVDVARGAGDEEIATELRSLPDAATYATLDELLLALGVGSAGRIDVPGAPERRPDSGPPTD